MHLAISGQNFMINAWINGNNKKRPNMKLSASKFNEKNVFRQFQKKKNFLRCQLYARAYVRIWTLRPWKPSINFPTNAIYLSSFLCFPLRITVLMLRESNSTAYLYASFFLDVLFLN